MSKANKKVKLLYDNQYVKLLQDNLLRRAKKGGTKTTRMWANAQPDGRPAKHRWRPLFNAAKFG